MRLRTLRTGVVFLIIFVALLLVDVALLVIFLLMPEKNYVAWGITAGVLVLIEFIIFWVGIILTYSTSVQLGIKIRVLGIIFGWVPIAHLIMLGKIIKTCIKEIRFENALIKRDAERKDDQVCRTKYPILLVHGVFFRDFKHLNYWGRIPKELEKNGAVIYYGNHNSAAAVRDSAKELEARVRAIMAETGCEKVNIIAHSKGGLDSRAMLSLDPSLAASLTTINTPHRGCEFAEYFFNKVPESGRLAIAKKYNYAAARLGDKDPDFISAVRDLTSSACVELNEEIKDVPGVYYRSVGSVLKKATSGKFPLNFTYHLVKHFDGENDGLVGIDSFPWGENVTLLRNEKSSRGISHGDVIDLNRENIDGFDVREFYVQLVHDLKVKGF